MVLLQVNKYKKKKKTENKNSEEKQTAEIEEKNKNKKTIQIKEWKDESTDDVIKDESEDFWNIQTPTTSPKITENSENIPELPPLFDDISAGPQDTMEEISEKFQTSFDSFLDVPDTSTTQTSTSFNFKNFMSESVVDTTQESVHDVDKPIYNDVEEKFDLQNFLEVPASPIKSSPTEESTVELSTDFNMKEFLSSTTNETSVYNETVENTEDQNLSEILYGNDGLLKSMSFTNTKVDPPVVKSPKTTQSPINLRSSAQLSSEFIDEDSLVLIIKSCISELRKIQFEHEETRSTSIRKLCDKVRYQVLNNHNVTRLDTVHILGELFIDHCQALEKSWDNSYAPMSKRGGFWSGPVHDFFGGWKVWGAE